MPKVNIITAGFQGEDVFLVVKSKGKTSAKKEGGRAKHSFSKASTDERAEISVQKIHLPQRQKKILFGYSRTNTTIAFIPVERESDRMDGICIFSASLLYSYYYYQLETGRIITTVTSDYTAQLSLPSKITAENVRQQKNKSCHHDGTSVG